MSTQPTGLLNNDELSLLDSLNASELEHFLSTADKSLVPIYLGQLLKYRQLKTQVNPNLALLPLQPHPRQAEFISLTCEEALFGGATGGGKTEALLMWLCEGVHIPGYSAAIFRRHETDLTEGATSVLSKSIRLYPALGGRLAGLEWKFPSGATITLEGIAHERSVLKQQGKEFHRVAFDELTHFTEYMYDFVYSNRIRKVVGFPIFCGARCSANPGGPGHDWVKTKFITQEAIEVVRKFDIRTPTPQGLIFWRDKDTAYVPSRAADNPSLDVEDYFQRQLKNKNPVERARMMNGDWGISPEGLIKPHYLRYYTMRDRMMDLLISTLDGQGGIVHSSEVLVSYHEAEARRFMTVDTAGGTKDITREFKGKYLSWTVAGVWDYWRKGNVKALILRDVWRGRASFTEVAHKLLQLHNQWGPTRTRVEDKTMGPDLCDLLKGKMPIDVIASGTIDKVARATNLLNMLDRGEVYLPKGNNSWLPTLLNEWLSWQGLEEETNDQVDMAAYAAIEVDGFMSGSMKVAVDPRKPVMAEPFGGGLGVQSGLGGFWS